MLCSEIYEDEKSFMIEQIMKGMFILITTYKTMVSKEAPSV